jgi:hypothetical protein
LVGEEILTAKQYEATRKEFDLKLSQKSVTLFRSSSFSWLFVSEKPAKAGAAERLNLFLR